MVSRRKPVFIATVLMAMILASGAFALWHKPKQAAGRPQSEAVSAFVGALNNRDWQSAYDKLSSDSQNGTTPDNLRDWRERRIPSGINGAQYSTSNADEQDVSVRLEADDGSEVALPLTIIREDSQWRIRVSPNFWSR